MKYSNDQILQIHRKGTAVEGKKYYSISGDVYIGLDNKRLKKLDSNELEQNSSIDINKEDISDIRIDITSLEATHKSDIEKLKCFSLAMSIVL